MENCGYCGEPAENLKKGAWGRKHCQKCFDEQENGDGD
jgi:hypothetical protein